MTSVRYENGAMAKPPDFVETTLLAETLLPLLGVKLPNRLDSKSNLREAGKKVWTVPPAGQLIKAKCIHMDGVRDRLSLLYSQNRRGLSPTHCNSKSQVLLHNTKSLKSSWQPGKVIIDRNKDSLVPLPPTHEFNDAGCATIFKKSLISPLVARRKTKPQYFTGPGGQSSTHLSNIDRHSIQATMEKNNLHIQKEGSPVLLLPSNLKRGIEKKSPKPF